MSPIFQTNRNQTWDKDGNLISDVSIQVDVTADTNAQTIRNAAVQALTTNRAYVALTSPTAAQTVAEVQALAQQNNGIIRLLLGLLDGTN